MEIETVGFCPYDSNRTKCQYIEGEKVKRCNLLIEIERKDTMGNVVGKESNCSMAWQPILTIELMSAIRGVQGTVQEFRNEMSEANMTSTQTMLAIGIAQANQVKQISNVL